MINKKKLIKLLEKVECLVLKEDDFSFCIFDFDGEKTSFINFELTQELDKQMKEKEEITIDDEDTVFFDIESVLNYLDKGKVFVPLSSCIGDEDEIHFLNGETICYEDFRDYEEEKEEKGERTFQIAHYNNLGVVLYKLSENNYDFKLGQFRITEGGCGDFGEFVVEELESLDEFTNHILECMKEFE